jgi:lysophospholipase L1-like esterase
LVPEVDHVYVDRGSPKDANGPLLNGLRRFRTDRNGIIIGGVQPASTTQKILFLGGSTTECNEIPEPLRFPAVVERLLREHGLDVIALNAGVRGHTTQDSINALLNHPGFRSANVVVLMHNINDRLMLGLRGDYDASLGNDAPTTGRAVLHSAGGLVTAVWNYIVYRSNSLFLLQYWSNKNLAWLDQPQHVEVSRDNIDLFQNTVGHRAKFEESLRIFVNIVRTLGKQPVLMTQPLGRRSTAQDAFNETIRDVAHREQVLLIDLDKTLGQNQRWAFFDDDIHLNAEGSLSVGKQIALEIARLFLSRPASALSP